MSLKLVVRIMYEVALPRPQQLVLERMAENAHDDGTESRPSVDLIAWKAGYKPRQVINIMRELEKAKIIVKVKEAAQHRPAEYDIHLEAAHKKMPFEEWRKIHGRYKGQAPRGAKTASLDEGDEEAPDVQSRGSGVQFENPGVQSRDSGVQSVAPEPSNEPSNESSDEPGGAGQKKEGKGRKDRSKPTPPDYRSKVETFLEANEDLADEILEFIAREAAKNDSGEMTYSRQWRAFCLPVELALQDDSDRGAVLYALQEANRMKARNMSYFETVLENNPQGRPRRRPSSNGGGASSSTPPAPEISGENGAARRKESYEWLFGEDGSQEEPSGTRETREDRRRREENERKQAEVAYGQRLKLAETEMRGWRSSMNDQSYQLQVTRLKRAAEKNGLEVEDIERLDEEIRADHAERMAG